MKAALKGRVKMKLSTKGRYGLKAIYEIARLKKDSLPVSLNVIAEKNQLSELYLEQIFARLRKADLIKSVRGAQGGYYLAREPSAITVGDVLRALEGPLSPSECASEEGTCEREKTCPTRVIWQKMKDSIDSVVDSITLEDMLRDEKRNILQKEMKEMSSWK